MKQQHNIRRKKKTTNQRPVIMFKSLNQQKLKAWLCKSIPQKTPNKPRRRITKSFKKDLMELLNSVRI